RIGRIEQPFRFDRFLQCLEDHARLDDTDHVRARDLDYPVHLFRRERDPAALGQGRAALARPAAPGNDWKPALSRETQDRLHVLSVSRLHHRLRRKTPGSTLVLLVLFRLGELQSQRGELVAQAHPNTSTALPVMAKGASAARNRTTLATSCGVICGGNGVWRSMSVSVDPGCTSAQKIPCSRPSSASDLMKPVRPHLIEL